MRERIRDVLPLRGRSLAGHPSGVVTVVATDVTVSAAVSNWGACAVAAALAVVLRDAEVLHDADSEHELIAATVATGARDGADPGARSRWTASGWRAIWPTYPLAVGREDRGPECSHQRSGLCRPESFRRYSPDGISPDRHPN